MTSIDINGLPAAVQVVLHEAQEYRSASLVEGYFERQVDLRTRGRPSQTDLMVLLRLETGHAIMAVEGKVSEMTIQVGHLAPVWCRSRSMVVAGK